MRIVWFSRHNPLPSQIQALREKFGEVELIINPQPFSSAEDIIQHFRSVGGDEMVVVAPLSVLGKLCELGIRPLWAEMEQVPPEQAETEANGRFYRFKGFKRVKRLWIEFEEI